VKRSESQNQRRGGGRFDRQPRMNRNDRPNTTSAPAPVVNEAAKKVEG
jgi:hypothetical protein